MLQLKKIAGFVLGSACVHVYEGTAGVGVFGVISRLLGNICGNPYM